MYLVIPWVEIFWLLVLNICQVADSGRVPLGTVIEVTLGLVAWYITRLSMTIPIAIATDLFLSCPMKVSPMLLSLIFES
jgi:predicted secreted protein